MLSGIFRTFSNTWSIIKTSMVVLRKDKELLLFPVMSFIGVGIVVAVAAIAFLAMGSFDRINSSGGGARPNSNSATPSSPSSRCSPPSRSSPTSTRP